MAGKPCYLGIRTDIYFFENAIHHFEQVVVRDMIKLLELSIRPNLVFKESPKVMQVYVDTFMGIFSQKWLVWVYILI